MTPPTKRATVILCLCLGLIFGITLPLSVENTRLTDRDFCQALPTRLPLPASRVGVVRKTPHTTQPCKRKRTTCFSINPHAPNPAPESRPVVFSF